MVRRPSPLLTAGLAYAGALALLLLAPALPGIGGTADANTILSDAPAMVLLGACVLVLLPARDELGALALLALGAGLLAAACTEAGAIALGDVLKALFAGALGLGLARLLAEPAVVVAVPLFVAAIDVASVAGGPTELLARDDSRPGEFISLYLPAWGGGRAGVIGVADLVFLGFFASGAWRFGLRRRVTAAALLAALPATLLAQVLLDRTVPALPALAAALLAPNADLLPGLVRRQPARRS